MPDKQTSLKGTFFEEAVVKYKVDKERKENTYLYLRCMLFPDLLKCWKLNFQYYSQIKMSQIILFWSNSQFKMPQIIVFRLNRVNKMLKNPKIAQKTHEIKMPRKFHAVKTSCLKLYARNFKYGCFDFKRRSIKKEMK